MRLPELLSPGRAVFAVWTMWIDELAAGFSVFADVLGLSQTPSYRLVLCDGTLQVRHERGGVLQAANCSDEQDFQSVATRLEPRDERVTLVLPQSLLLRRTITLNAAAGRRWREAVRLQFDSWFPLPETACLWNARAERVGEELRTRVVIAHRSVVERIVEALAEKGWRITHIVAHDDANEFDLTPRATVAPLRVWRRVNYALAALTVLLLGTTLWYALDQREQEQDALTELLRMSRKTAQSAIQTRDTLQAGLAALTPALAAQRQPSVTAMLEKLSGALPPEGWISHLSWEEGEVTFTGSAPPDLDWLHLLKNSLAVDAQFVNGVPEDSTSPRVTSTLSFHIGAQ